MSQIDQAFIRAYTSDPQPATQLEDLPPASLDQQALEPHFGETGGADPYLEIAALQQATIPPQAPVVEPSPERRPLSSFAAPQTPASQGFSPLFEIDGFRWPAIVGEILDTNSHLLMPAAQQLLDASEAGRSMVGIAGARPGVGVTTIHLCLAHLLASAGKMVAIVDGDFVNRSLAQKLGLQFDTGWENVLTGRAPLAECVVNSIADRIALLPLVGHETPPTELLANIQTSISAGVLRYHYDVVLFDLGAAGAEPQLSAARDIVERCRIDASIIVADSTDTRQTTQQQSDHLMSLLGPSCLGMIGNDAL
jgi:Mrp family chromosome partitioning ATPase